MPCCVLMECVVSVQLRGSRPLSVPACPWTWTRYCNSSGGGCLTYIRIGPSVRSVDCSVSRSAHFLDSLLFGETSKGVYK